MKKHISKRLDIYGKLREAHRIIKDILSEDSVFLSGDAQDRNAIEAVSAVLYLAESELCREV